MAHGYAFGPLVRAVHRGGVSVVGLCDVENQAQGLGTDTKRACPVSYNALAKSQQAE